MSDPVRRVAHFLQNSNLLGSPPNEAIVAAYQSLGWNVDLYSTWPSDPPGPAQPGLELRRIEYSRRWLLLNVARPFWRHYGLFSATTEDPMAAAGVLSRLWRRPLITLADEIRSGTYAGNRSQRWKDICRLGMRGADLTIVNESERIALQRDYVRLAPDSPVLIYPGCFRNPPAPGNRAALRASRGLPGDALVLCYSGGMSEGNGGLWMADALRQCPLLWVWGQIVNLDPLTRGLLARVQGSDRLVLERQRMGWNETWASMAAADIGMVVYLQDAPQYRHMGIASNRLCMFLAMGVPVIASRQPSFEFIKRYECGVLIDGPGDIPAAVDRIGSRLTAMRGNALECARNYIKAPQRWLELRDAIARILLP